jgi:hypothetical protein
MDTEKIFLENPFFQKQTISANKQKCQFNSCYQRFQMGEKTKKHFLAISKSGHFKMSKSQT